jgi:hypothetical protein
MLTSNSNFSRGLFYITNDGGVTWNKLTDPPIGLAKFFLKVGKYSNPGLEDGSYEPTHRLCRPNQPNNSVAIRWSVIYSRRPKQREYDIGPAPADTARAQHGKLPCS